MNPCPSLIYILKYMLLLLLLFSNPHPAGRASRGSLGLSAGGAASAGAASSFFLGCSFLGCSFLAAFLSCCNKEDVVKLSESSKMQKQLPRVGSHRLVSCQHHHLKSSLVFTSQSCILTIASFHRSFISTHSLTFSPTLLYPSQQHTSTHNSQLLDLHTVRAVFSFSIILYFLHSNRLTSFTLNSNISTHPNQYLHLFISFILRLVSSHRFSPQPPPTLLYPPQ